MPTLTLSQEIQTVRINELPNFLGFRPLATTDEMVLFLPDLNKTVKFSIADLYAFVHDVEAGTFTPVVLGDEVIYEVPVSANNGVIASIPELAGKNFSLTSQTGYPYKTNEFEILNSGGFKLLKTGEVLSTGDRYKLRLYSLVGGSPVDSNTSKPLIVGNVQVSTNTTYDVVNHVNKLLQIRGGSTQLQFTLPLVDDIPDNTIIIIETMIGNTVEHKIQTQGGQLIYMNNTSYTALGVRPGEVLMLYRQDDGYMVINQDFAKLYREIGVNPKPSFKVGLNEVALNGSLVSKTSIRRLYETAQTFGGSFINRATYDSDPVAYKAYWVDWDTNNLRLPDLSDLFLRPISSGTAGRFQDEAVNITTDVRGVKGGPGTSGTIAGSVDSVNPGGGEFDLTHNYAISPKQGTETRPVNAGFPFVVNC